MRKIRFSAVLTALLLAGAVASSAPRRALADQAPAVKLKVGDVAPDFKLQYFDGKELKDVTLGQYRGKKNVVLAFYVFAFTGG